MSWQFLADIAYSIEPNNPVFKPGRVRAKARLDIYNARQKLSA